MTDQTIADKCRKIISEITGTDAAAITNEKTFESLAGDSLEIVECQIEVEDQLGIYIPDSELSLDMTVGAFIEKAEKYAND